MRDRLTASSRKKHNVPNGRDIVNPFQIQKALDAIAGPVQNCTRMRNGCLLVETSRAVQSEMLPKANRMLNFGIAVERHRTLNTCRGVVRSDAFDGLGEDEILGYLEPWKVLSVLRVMMKRNDILTPSRTQFLTFDYLTIPSHIKAGYERIHVHQYIPAPRHCFKCQQFGQTQQICRRQLLYV